MTIREYETWPQRDDHDKWVWENKRSVDLTWVASAAPSFVPNATSITLAGGGLNTAIDINVPYPEFMRDWMAARGQAKS